MESPTVWGPCKNATGLLLRKSYMKMLLSQPPEITVYWLNGLNLVQKILLECPEVWVNSPLSSDTSFISLSSHSLTTLSVPPVTKKSPDEE